MKARHGDNDLWLHATRGGGPVTWTWAAEGYVLVCADAVLVLTPSSPQGCSARLGSPYGVIVGVQAAEGCGLAFTSASFDDCLVGCPRRLALAITEIGFLGHGSRGDRDSG